MVSKDFLFQENDEYPDGEILATTRITIEKGKQP